MKIIAIDPGVMTGYCYAKVGQKLTYAPFQATDEVDDLWRRLHTFQPRYIIMEDFEVRRGNLARGGLNLFPVQLIGVARLYAETATEQCALYLQKAAQGKGYYTDATLKSLGFYKRGIPHGMDASRHLLQWFTFGAGYQYNNGTQRDFAEMIELGAF